MKTLYIIGNGFDLHHGLKTRYTDFLLWLKKNRPEAYDNLLNVYNKPDDINKTWEWWSMFESHLVDIDLYDDMIEVANENPINYAADDFREGDRYAGAMEAESKFQQLMSDVQESFEDWVNSLSNIEVNTKLGNIDTSATFINFNYTETLERLYGVPSDRVFHFHGKCGDSEYVLGHGRSYDEIKDNICGEIVPPANLTPEEEADWYSQNYDEVLENVIDATMSTLASYKKNVGAIIAKNESLYSQMADLQKIIIYGYSFSEIDNPYLYGIINRVDNHSELSFEVNWFSDSDLKNIESFFSMTKIRKDQISYVRLSDYNEEIQGRLF